MDAMPKTEPQTEIRRSLAPRVPLACKTRSPCKTIKWNAKAPTSGFGSARILDVDVGILVKLQCRRQLAVSWGGG